VIDRRRSLAFALALAALTTAVYASSCDNRFVNYDDDLYVSERPELRQGLSRDALAWAFTSTQGANWFPLTRLSWLLDAELFGVEAGAFHAVSLALHVASALLLFAAFLRLSGRFGPSAFVAGVFALHPLHVESVAWAAARKDVLSGLFFMLALLAHERRARAGRPALWGALLCVILALGLLAKPMLVTLPCVLLLLDEWPLGRVRSAPGAAAERGRVRSLVLEKLPLFALAAAACVVTVIAQREGGALRDAELYPWWLRVANAFDAYLVYLRQAFWPTGLAVFYPYPHAGLPLERVAAAALVVVGASVLVWRELPRRPHLAVGWFWFVGMLVPVIGIVQVGQAAAADRYTYLPLIGLSVMVAWGAAEFADRWSWLRAPLRNGAALALLALAYAASAQVGVWRNSQSLFEHALAVTERNHVAHINLGATLARAGRHADAEDHLTRAIAIAPHSASAFGLRGEVRVAQERAAEAVLDFENAARLEPDSARWRAGLARALAEGGDLEAAEAAARDALRRDSHDVPAHLLLGGIQARRGRLREAEAHYRAALLLVPALGDRFGPPSRAALHERLAAVLLRKGEREQALAQLEEAMRLDPELASYAVSRASLLEGLGREAEAVAAYRAVLERERSPRALNNLAWLLATSRRAELRDPEAAVELALEAVAATRSEDPTVLDTLATAYDAADRRELAESTTRRALELAEAQQHEVLAASLRERLVRLEAAPGS
jgi:tetratricopeptide (TPR) repeat protein